MTFIYVIYLIYGDPDDNTCFEAMSFHQTLIGAQNWVASKGKLVKESSREEYKRAHDSTWWREPPTNYVIEKTTVWL